MVVGPLVEVVLEVELVLVVEVVEVVELVVGSV
jgi:hypothetical protein